MLNLGWEIFYLLYWCYVQVNFCVQICIHVKFGFNFCVQICIHVKFGFKYNEEISLFFECSSKFKRSKSICNNVVSISYCPNFDKTRNEVWISCVQTLSLFFFKFCRDPWGQYRSTSMQNLESVAQKNLKLGKIKEMTITQPFFALQTPDFAWK